MKKLNYLQIIAILLFIFWSVFFIYRTSFIALDGQRYFSLADDAMISMRYAWNLSHGHGLVWNVGEYVEGYTNLLMTLIMAIVTALFDKKGAVLVIQILGIPTCLFIATLTRKIADRFYPGNRWTGNLAFIGALFYFPLSFWSLSGMETGLVTALLLYALLLALKWRDDHAYQHPWGMAIFLGLAFLTRNDALIFSLIIFAFVFIIWWQSSRDQAQLKFIFLSGLLFCLFIIGQQLFRLWYYGALVPNTYTLKVSGIPLYAKIKWGISYVTPFLLQSSLILIISILEVIRQRFKNVILGAFIVAAVAYEISVGGDPWPEWRILTPGMPCLFILIGAACEWFSNRVLSKAPQLAKEFAFALLLVNLVVLNYPFHQYFDFSTEDVQARSNGHNVNMAIGLNNLTTTDATIGVFWAGALPYYVDRKAIDFLGKSDQYIANLPAHLEIGRPGHNKFDLAYSIRKLQPTFIQDFRQGSENLRPWVIKNYVRVNYATPDGDITLILSCNNPSVVNWAKGKIIPWPEGIDQKCLDGIEGQAN